MTERKRANSIFKFLTVIMFVFICVLILPESVQAADFSADEYFYEGREYQSGEYKDVYYADKDNNNYWVVSNGVWHQCRLYDGSENLDTVSSAVRTAMLERKDNVSFFFVTDCAQINEIASGSNKVSEQERLNNENTEYIADTVSREVYKQTSDPASGDYLEFMSKCSDFNGTYRLTASDSCNEFSFYFLNVNIENVSTAREEALVKEYLAEWNDKYINSNDVIKNAQGENKKYYTVKTIYNFIAKNTIYDLAVYNKEVSEDSEQYRFSHSAYGALFGNIQGAYESDVFDYKTLSSQGGYTYNVSMSYDTDSQGLYRIKMRNQGRSVCDGYSLVFYYLCRLNNIDCRIVKGDNAEGMVSDPHAWNMVYLMDDTDTAYEWYSVDVTFGCQKSRKFSDEFSVIDYGYFLRGSENKNFSADNHQQLYDEYKSLSQSDDDYTFTVNNIDEKNLYVVATRRRDADADKEFVDTGVYNLEDYLIIDPQGKYHKLNSDGSLGDATEEGFVFNSNGYYYSCYIYDFVKDIEYTCDDKFLRDIGSYEFNIVNSVNGVIYKKTVSVDPLDLSNKDNYNLYYQKEVDFKPGGTSVSIKIYDNAGTLLSEGKDYKVYCYAEGEEEQETKNVNGIGTYFIKIKYIGNYKGYIELEFIIKNADFNDISISNSNIAVSYGDDIASKVAVFKAEGVEMYKDVDYSVTVKGSTEYGGKGTITLTALSTSKYLKAGTTKTITYEVKYRRDMSEVFNGASISFKKPIFYAGGPITVQFNSKYILPNGQEVYLTEGTDFDITGYANNTNAGKASVFVTFKGNYTGKAEMYFNIDPLPAEKCTAKLSATSYNYTGNPIGPGVSVVDCNGRKLVYKTDYTLTYAPGRTEPGRYSVVVNYMGNYSGSTTLYFTIKDPYKFTVKLSASTYTYSGNSIGPGVTVTDADGKKLVYKTDYTLTYAPGRINVGRYGITVNYIGKYAGTPSETVYFDITAKPASQCTAKLSATDYVYTGKAIGPGVSIVDNNGRKLVYKTDYTLVYAQGRIEPGRYSVVVNYMGNYSGSATLYFNINDPAVITAKLSASKYTYTGKDIGPGVTVTDGTGKKLVYKTDYTLTYAAGRTNVGRYGITVNYIGKYAGTPSETLYFDIVAKPASQCTAKPSAWSYYYTGKSIGPGMTVTDNTGRKLVYKTDYTLTYEEGRTNVGRYYIRVNYMGNYTGTTTIYFYIIPKQVSLKTLTPISKGFTVQWYTQKEEITGYQVQYSRYSNFSNSAILTFANPSAYSVTRNNMGSDTKYYVRIRTYKVVNIDGKSTILYSGWSSTKYVTTKK